jgi:FkbM family methyltransferase
MLSYIKKIYQKVYIITIALLSIITHPLNKQNKTKALKKFFQFYFLSRLIPGRIIYNWINDIVFIADRNESGVTGNIYCGLDEFESMSFLLHVLRSGDYFVDVGSNVGIYTLLANGMIGSKGICIEPNPKTFQRLLHNLQLNQIKAFRPLNIAIGNHEGELKFTSDENCTAHVLSAEENHSNIITVRSKTLDEVISFDPFLMKIDVEGYEYPVIEGGCVTIGKCKCLIIELCGNGQRYGFKEEKIVEKLKIWGFKPYTYDPFKRELKNENKISYTGNVIFVRDKGFILSRIKKANTVEINGVRF